MQFAKLSAIDGLQFLMMNNQPVMVLPRRGGIVPNQQSMFQVFTTGEILCLTKLEISELLDECQRVLKALFSTCLSAPTITRHSIQNTAALVKPTFPKMDQLSESVIGQMVGNRLKTTERVGDCDYQVYIRVSDDSLPGELNMSFTFGSTITRTTLYWLKLNKLWLVGCKDLREMRPVFRLWQYAIEQWV